MSEKKSVSRSSKRVSILNGFVKPLDGQKSQERSKISTPQAVTASKSKILLFQYTTTLEKESPKRKVLVRSPLKHRNGII